MPGSERCLCRLRCKLLAGTIAAAAAVLTVSGPASAAEPKPQGTSAATTADAGTEAGSTGSDGAGGARQPEPRSGAAANRGSPYLAPVDLQTAVSAGSAFSTP